MVAFNIPKQSYDNRNPETGVYYTSTPTDFISDYGYGLLRVTSNQFKVENRRRVGIEWDLTDFHAGMRALMESVRLKNKTGYTTMDQFLWHVARRARELAPRQSEEEHERRHPGKPHLDEAIYYFIATSGYGFVTCDLDYAAVQHETQEYDHVLKGEWKYIEKAMYEISKGPKGLKKVGMDMLHEIMKTADAKRINKVHSSIQVNFRNYETELNRP